MPAPRGEDSARRGDNWTRRTLVQARALPAARPITDQERQRLYRRGVRVGRGSAGAGRSTLVWGSPVNGLPFRPYVYRGTGADAFTGEVVEL